ncbi:hypothetical protein MMC12_000108 [Toensbergia leucococca]|nr:hypothetical protein [Toensbergia leucococca]
MAAGSIPPTLPPSVEEAYKNKCIQLRRRVNEVEESNDAYRIRKVRLMRGIRKMRLERAILLETLGKRMKKNGVGGGNGMFDEESEGSSDGPPTPLEKPLRSKRSHRRPVASPPPLPQHLSMSHNLQLSHPTFQTLTPTPNPLSTTHPPPAFQPGPQPPTNGTPTHHHHQPNPLAQSTYSPPQPPPNYHNTHHQPHQPPRPPLPFDDFYETCFRARPADHPNCHSEDQLREVALGQWAELEREGLWVEGLGSVQNWVARYEERMRKWQEEMDEWKRRGRGGRGASAGFGAAGREGRGGDDVDMDGSGGGFTAVNG